MVTTLPTAHMDRLQLHFDDEGLLGGRRASGYNETEREYSVLLYKRIEQLLRGERNALLIMRKYPAEPERLGVMSTPNALDREALRIELIERLSTDALVFLSAHAPGGPVAQRADADGTLTETRKFPTLFPHIIIERHDVYRAATLDVPEHIEWNARRLQNARKSIRLNHMLDVAGLGMDVAKLLLP